jgi:hypothetical protein
MPPEGTMKYENLYAPAGRQSGGVGAGFPGGLSSALSLIIFRIVTMPPGGAMNHENRGADFLVCWQAGKPAPHCLFSE